MGGSLEGICARGLADAIVDLRETGGSLARNPLHTIQVAAACEAIFVKATDDHPAVEAMTLRIEAAQAAKRTQ